MPADDDENQKNQKEIRTDVERWQGVTFMRVGTQLLSQKICVSFLLSERDYVILPY